MGWPHDRAGHRGGRAVDLHRASHRPQANLFCIAIYYLLEIYLKPTILLPRFLWNLMNFETWTYSTSQFRSPWGTFSWARFHPAAQQKRQTLFGTTAWQAEGKSWEKDGIQETPWFLNACAHKRLLCSDTVCDRFMCVWYTLKHTQSHTHTHTCTHSFIQIWLSLIKFVYMFVFSHCRESNRSRVYPGLVDHFDDTKIDVLSRPRPWQRLSLVSQALWKCHGGREIQEGQGP